MSANTLDKIGRNYDLGAANAIVTHTHNQLLQLTGVDIAALEAEHADKPDVHKASEYVSMQLSKVVDAERKFFEGETCKEADSRAADNEKFYYAMLVVLLDLPKNTAITAAWPGDVFRKMAEGKRNPSSIHPPRANKELEVVYGEHRQIIRSATPKIQRAVVQAATCLEKYTSEGWIYDNEKLTQKEKLAVDVAKFVLEKCYLSPLTNSETFKLAGPGEGGDKLADGVKGLLENKKNEDSGGNVSDLPGSHTKGEW